VDALRHALRYRQLGRRTHFPPAAGLNPPKNLRYPAKTSTTLQILVENARLTVDIPREKTECSHRNTLRTRINIEVSGAVRP
jgi:hypothetical protein